VEEEGCRSVASRGAQRRSTRTLVALGAAVVAGLVLVPGASHADPQSISEVREELERLNHEVVVVTEDYNVAVERVKAAEQELRVVQARAAAQREALDVLQQQMGTYAAMAYRSAGIDETLQLLTTDDPQQFLEQATTLDQLSAQQADALRRVQLAREELERTRLQATEKLEEIEAISNELKAKKKEIESKQRAVTALLNRLTEEQRAALAAQRAAEEEQTAEVPVDVPASGRAQAAVDFAKAQLGEPYVWSGDGPDSWDCSGLTMMSWRAAGVSLPHSSSMQYSYGTHVSKSELQPGDLVFFYSPISHVGIFIGGGMMIHAPSPGDVVKVASISQSPWAGATRPG
jgi:peptidoglycan DL-endopeptidase CwlO